MDSIDFGSLDPAVFLTMAGGTIGAGIITGIVEVLKRLGGLGVIIARHAAETAFVLSLLLVAASYASVTTIGGGTEAVSVWGVLIAVIAAFGMAAIATKTYDVASARLSSGGE